MNYCLPLRGHTITLVVFKLCVAGLNFSVTRFYRLLLMNGINSTLILRTVILMRSVGHKIYGIYDPFGVELIHRLRLGFSHLREHRLRHNFVYTVNPLC